MPDSKKVIYAIERCTCHVPYACRDCPYDAGHPYNECVEMLLKDAIELLKEHEPVRPKAWVPKGQTMARVRGYYCPVCDTSVVRGDRFCHWCGRELTWDE